MARILTNRSRTVRDVDDHIGRQDDESFLTDVASTSRTMDNIAFLCTKHNSADNRLFVESTPSSPPPIEMDDCYVVSGFPRFQQMLELNIGKSPVSIVNEIALSHGEQIHYNLISASGKMHCPEFTYCLTYKNISVVGNGNSKKEAKKNTAIAFLKKLDFVNNTETSTQKKKKKKPNINNTTLLSENHEVKTIDVIPKLNYIGILQELCMSRHWELPEYEFCQKELNENTWSVICCIQLYKSKGVDKSKQTAKNKSAYFMYEYIKDLSQEEITFFNYHECQILNNYNKSFIDMSTLTKCLGSNIQVKMFSNILKSKKTYINNLKICNCISEFNMNFVDILEKIGEEEGFNVEYEVKIVEEPEKFEVFVKLSLTPILIHMCSGNILEETQEEVASDILLYFKLLLTN